MLLSRARSKILVGVLITLILSAAVAFLLYHHDRVKAADISHLYVGVTPLPKNSPVMSPTVLRQVIVEDFQVVRKLRYLPSAVKESFCNVETCNHVGTKFDMVDPGETMSTDLMLPGVPNKRLVFAALNPRSAILVFEQGGYVSSVRATILDFKEKSSSRSDLDYRTRDFESLRNSILLGEYGTASSAN